MDVPPSQAHKPVPTRDAPPPASSRYGPRTALVESRIEQLNTMNVGDVRALLRIQRTLRSFEPDIRHPDIRHLDGPTNEADRTAFQRLAVRDTSSIDGAGRELVVFEVVGDLLTPATYDRIMAPLDLVVSPPLWWAEPGSRALFFEMLESGASLGDARDCVSAL